MRIVPSRWTTGPTPRDRKSFQRPTASIRWPETKTAPLSMGGCATGKTTRARRNMDRMESWRKGVMRKGDTPTLHYALAAALDTRFLALALDAGGLGVFAGFVFVVPLADLLLNLFGDKINRRVKVSFAIFSEQVRPRHGQSHGAGKLFFGGLSVVVLQRHARIDGETVKVVKLVAGGNGVILASLPDRHIVRRENQFHGGMLRRRTRKIQSNPVRRFRGNKAFNHQWTRIDTNPCSTRG